MDYCARITAEAPINAPQLLRKPQVLRAQYCDIIFSELTINLGVLNILFNLSYKK